MKKILLYIKRFIIYRNFQGMSPLAFDITTVLEHVFFIKSDFQTHPYTTQT